MGFLALGPSVRETGYALLIRNNFISRLNNWFALLRKVEVIPSKCLILYKTRKFYFWNRLSALRFEDIEYIDCSCDATPVELSGWFGSGAGELKTNEFFIVSFMTKSSVRYPVALYRGLATEITGYCGNILKGSESRYIPQHERKAFELASRLAEITGAPVGKKVFSGIKTIKCRECGREIAVAGKRCLYCGTEKPEEEQNNTSQP